MTPRLAAALLVVVSAALALPVASAQRTVAAGPEAAIELPFGRAAWDLTALYQDPVKLEKISAVKVPIQDEKEKDDEKEKKDVKDKHEARFVKFILQFQRDLTVRDAEWNRVRPQPPYAFRFLDENGVILASESATFDSVLVGLEGRRVQMLLKLPDAPVVQNIDIVDPRFGERLTLLLPGPPVSARTKKVIVDFKPYGS
jgi:hypothetical protein